MNIFVSQIYIEVGVAYPFSHHFQVWVSHELSRRVQPSAAFVAKYGEDYNVVFNLSAKSAITEPEIRGPSVFRKTKDVEFTIFLPHSGQQQGGSQGYQRPMELLLRSIVAVLKGLGLDASHVEQDCSALIQHVISDPAMIEQEPDSGVDSPIP